MLDTMGSSFEKVNIYEDIFSQIGVTKVTKIGI
jgi:hypothetical protein